MTYIIQHAFDCVVSLFIITRRGRLQVEKYQNDTKNTARIESIEDHDNEHIRGGS